MPWYRFQLVVRSRKRRRSSLRTLEFRRFGDSAEHVVLEGIAEALRAEADAKLVAVAPDLVTLSEAADLAGCSRQALRKRAATCPVFPLPVYAGNTELYPLATLLPWLHAWLGHRAEPGTVELARVARRCNLALQVGPEGPLPLPYRGRVARWGVSAFARAGGR